MTVATLHKTMNRAYRAHSHSLAYAPRRSMTSAEERQRNQQQHPPDSGQRSQHAQRFAQNFQPQPAAHPPDTNGRTNQNQEGRNIPSDHREPNGRQSGIERSAEYRDERRSM